MTSNSEIDSIRHAVETILGCGNDFAAMKNAIDILYEKFSNITNISAGQLNQDDCIQLQSGKAISKTSAALCLLDIGRTATFLRGINKALKKKKQEKSGVPTRVLYAGTGPFGTLVIPLLLLHRPCEIMVDLLDINHKSLDALQEIISTLGLATSIGSIYHEDATTFKISKHYDIVVSETMQACLKNEPQVAIMQNLIPQLHETSVFIPQEITVDANLTNNKMEQDRIFSQESTPSFHRISLGNVFKVNKDHLDTTLMKKQFVIPADVSEFPVFKLFTTVTVFGNQVLGENESSITMPIKYLDFRNEHGNKVECTYVQGVKPRIECKIIDNTIVTSNFNII